MKTNNITFKNGFIGLLLFCNIICLIYILVLGYYNCPDLDDLSFLGHIREHGFWGSLKLWYFFWQGRFCPHFTINTFITIYKFTHSLLPYTICYILLFIFALNRLIKSLFEIPFFIRLNVSFFVFSVILFSTFEFNTFFWLTASTMYFGGPLFLIFGISAIFNKSNHFFNALILILSFFYVGCSAEHFGLLALLVIFAIILFLSYRKSFVFRVLIHEIIFQRFMMAFIFTLISFMIMVLAPGNSIRSGLIVHPDLKMQFIIFISSVKTTLFYTFTKFPSYILTALIFKYIGSYYTKNSDYPDHSILKIFLVLFTIYLGLVLFNAALFVHVVGGLPDLRTMVYLTFFIHLSIAYCAIKYGMSGNINSNQGKNNILYSLLLIIYAGFIIDVYRKEVPLVKNYSIAFEKRINLLNDHNKTNLKDTLYIEKLPGLRYLTYTDRFILFSNYTNTMNYSSETPIINSEISEDYDWTNSHLEFGLKLKYPVKLALNKLYSADEMDRLLQHYDLIDTTVTFKLYQNESSFIFMIDSLSIASHQFHFLSLGAKYTGVNPFSNPVINILNFKISHHLLYIIGEKYMKKLVVSINKPVFPIKYLKVGLCKSKEDDPSVIWEGELKYHNKR